MAERTDASELEPPFCGIFLPDHVLPEYPGPASDLTPEEQSGGCLPSLPKLRLPAFKITLPRLSNPTVPTSNKLPAIRSPKIVETGGGG